MGLFDGYDVAASGMGAQRQRVNIVSANIANAQTTHTQDGGPYKKQNIVFEEVLLQAQKGDDTSTPEAKNEMALKGVGVKTVLESKDDPMMRYEPNHPDANEKGYVAYPNINPVVEMVDLTEAVRSYEANVTAFQTQKQLDTKTLEILKA